MSSICGQLKSYLWGIDGDRTIAHDRKSHDWKLSWPEVTGSDVITGSMFCACPGFSPAFFSYYSNTKCNTVVQVPLLPEVTKGQVTPSGFHWVCAEMTSSNITRRASSGSHVIGSTLGELSMTSASYYRFLALSLVIYPFPTILFS